MQIIRSIKKIQKLTHQLASDGQRIGLVPTMGYLHQGHISLIHRARKISDIVIVTIFVNPTQFALGEDLDRYPRDESGDLAKIKLAGGDIVFIPGSTEIYENDFQTFVNVEKLTQSLEGTVRPTHFRGVTTIVAKLFNMIRPDIAVFGMKDYQQAAVIRQMARDLNYPIRIIVAPTVREKDGLAMSSRNKYFNVEQRQEAVCLYRSLIRAKDLIRGGERRCHIIRKQMKAVIKDICPCARIDYIAFTHWETLRPMDKIDRDCICSLAVRLHQVRLIDNLKLL